MKAATVLMSVTWSALTACGAPQEKGDAAMETLRALVLAKNPEAAIQARQLGRRAAPLLEELSTNEDPGVRRVALNSFREIGGSEAVKAFLRGLADEDPQVAGSAAGGFHRSFEPTHAAGLLAAYAKASDPLTRQEIALFLGRSDQVDLKVFRKLRAAERDPLALEGDIVGLARLGETDAQEEFVRRLHASKERERLRYMDHVAYLGQRWVLKPLLPLLDDKNGLVTQGVDARPDEMVTLRACDLAVQRAAAISGRTFSFPVDPVRNYKDSEVDEVRRYLKGLP